MALHSIGRAARHPALAAALAALALAGCRDESDVLARVQDQPITIKQFTAVARAALQQYPGSADSARSRLLTDMVQRELLVKAAQQEKLDGTPEYQAYRTTLQRQLLREALFRKLAGGPFPVSEAETKLLYERRRLGTKTRLIYSFNEDLARRAAQDLAHGEDFAVVANRYNPANMVPPGGDIGVVQPGALLPPLDDAVRTGPVGQVIGPIEAPGQGWFLLRLDERKPVSQPPYEKDRPGLIETIRQRKQRVTALHVVDMLRGLYQVRVVPGAPQGMVQTFRNAPPGMQPLPAPVRAQVLATYIGGSYTLGDAYDDIVAGGTRPNVDVTPATERWIEAQAVERAGIAEALKRHLDEDPEIQERMRDRLNNYLLDGYYNREVVQRIQVSPADLAALYERFKPSFARLGQAKIQSVTIRDSATAAALAAQAGQAPSLREAAAAAAAGAWVKEETVTYPSTTPPWATFESRFSAMRPGEIVGPFPNPPKGWTIVQLVSKQSVVPPIEALSPAALQQLQNAAIEMRREARLNALTDSLRRVIRPVVVYAERLRRVPWPPAPAIAGT